MPPIPKPASTRARRNKVAGARTLATVHDAETPDLPAGRTWHPFTIAWWTTLWSDPMAPEYVASDVILGLRMLAVEVNYYWELDELAGQVGETAEYLAVLRMMNTKAAEVRLQGQRFGTSPLDRRRLQWEIERAEAAEQQTIQRRNDSKPRSTGSRAKKPADPRSMLA